MDVRSRPQSCKRVFCALMVVALLACLVAVVAQVQPVMIRDRVSGGGDREPKRELARRMQPLLIKLPKGTPVPPSGPSPIIN
ncbi:hypothetical protein NL676_000889 [Syzygium grande]|nr:hypothetical protein NL676_000889 [Syzygium grande]